MRVHREPADRYRVHDEGDYLLTHDLSTPAIGDLPNEDAELVGDFPPIASADRRSRIRPSMVAAAVTGAVVVAAIESHFGQPHGATAPAGTPVHAADGGARTVKAKGRSTPRSMAVPTVVHRAHARRTSALISAKPGVSRAAREPTVVVPRSSQAPAVPVAEFGFEQ